MVPVVEYLTRRSDWNRRRPGLESVLTQQLIEFSSVNVLDERERVAFFQRQLSCAFLKDNRCEIYAVRPAVCRYHMVVSSPENCAHSPMPKPIVLVDLRKIEHDIAIKGAEAFGELMGGPIALAFVFAAKLLGVKLDIDRALINRVTLVRIEVQT
jgi:Fe-S-cluster containining protein